MGAAPPLVSAVIPTYNRAAIVGEAIQSVLDQTFPHVEIIVVDDGSTDDTATRVRAFDDARVRYLGRERNAGVAAARNAGVAASKGSLIAFLDSDDLWMPEKLDVTVDFLERHGEVEAVFTDLEKREGSEITPSFVRQAPVFARRLGGRTYPDGLVLDQREMFLCLLQEVPIKPSAFTIRRAAFERLGGFDESWSSSEDWEFFLRLADVARFGYVDRPLSLLRIRGDSLHRRDLERGLRAALALYPDLGRRFAHDREARAAVRSGVTVATKHLSWHRAAHGRRWAAARAYVDGFRLTGDAALLVRAAAVFVPEPAVRAAKRALRIAGPSSTRSS